jgi:hypothetical protein
MSKEGVEVTTYSAKQGLIKIEDADSSRWPAAVPATSSRSPIKKFLSPTTGSKVQQAQRGDLV